MALNVIGELINHAYARARRAFTLRDAAGYQHLARLQADLGVQALSINLNGTQRFDVTTNDMLARLPDVIRAVQEATTLPLAFDSPVLEYHQVALAHYDSGRGGQPILNSVAASRSHLDEWLKLVARYDTRVVVMASERVASDGPIRSLRVEDFHAVAKYFVQRLVSEAGRTRNEILIDPGLFPFSADTYARVSTGLDVIRLIRHDPDLAGVHCIVGLSNFAWNAPAGTRSQLENAYLTLAMEAGLDYAIANPERAPAPLASDHAAVSALRQALATSRVAAT